MKVEIEVSIGELYDKITILRIKKERVTDSNKLQNVIKESCKTLPNVAKEFKKITKNKDILNTSCMGTEFHASSDVQQIKCMDVKDTNIFMKQRYSYLTKKLKIN